MLSEPLRNTPLGFAADTKAPRRWLPIRAAWLNMSWIGPMASEPADVDCLITEENMSSPIASVPSKSQDPWQCKSDLSVTAEGSGPASPSRAAC